MSPTLTIREKKLGPDHYQCLLPIQGLGLYTEMLAEGDKGMGLYKC